MGVGGGGGMKDCRKIVQAFISTIWQVLINAEKLNSSMNIFFYKVLFAHELAINIS